MNKISKWLKFFIDNTSIKKGVALDLACGKGRHSKYLSEVGFSVIAVDINKESLKCFSEKNITKLFKDVEDKKNWPLVKYKFDIIVVTNFLNRTIFPMIINSLNKGGFLIYETFSEGHQRIGKPNNPKYILQPKELISLCSPLSLVAYEEIYVKCPSNHSFKQRIISLNV